MLEIVRRCFDQSREFEWVGVEFKLVLVWLGGIKVYK